MKLYKDHRYENKKIKKNKGLKGKILPIIGVGVIIVSIAAFTKVSAQRNSINKDEINVPSPTYSTSIEENNIKEIKNIDDPFLVGSSEYKKNVIDFLSSPSGNLIYKYSKEFGVDPNIIAAMGMQESTLDHNATIPGGDMYSGFGVGLLQLESPDNQEITAYNYETGEYETEYITMENACNLEKNIKLGCMIFQNSLENNKGNIYLAIQSHNYGQPMLDLILDSYNPNIKEDYKNTTWIDSIKQAHNAPYTYLSDWEYDTYGDGDYIKNVLRFAPRDKVKYKYNGMNCEFDLKTKELTTEEIIQHNK